MFSSGKKIITAAQLKTPEVSRSVVMQNFKKIGGAQILRKNIQVSQFWQKMRDDSKQRKFGQRGFTKNNLERFFGKLRNDKKDHFTDGKVDEMAALYGLKRSHIIDYAAEARHKEHTAEVQQAQAKAQERRQQEIAFHNRINATIKKGTDKARTAMSASQPKVEHSADKEHILEENRERIFEVKQNPDFEVSNKNVRNAEQRLIHHNVTAPMENHSNAFGHLMFLKNRQHNYVGEQDTGIADAKARLARIQGETDNKEDDKDSDMAS